MTIITGIHMYASQWGISCVYPHNKFKTDLAEKKMAWYNNFFFFVEMPTCDSDDGIERAYSMVCYS